MQLNFVGLVPFISLDQIWLTGQQVLKKCAWKDFQKEQFRGKKGKIFEGRIQGSLGGFRADIGLSTAINYVLEKLCAREFAHCLPSRPQKNLFNLRTALTLFPPFLHRLNKLCQKKGKKSTTPLVCTGWEIKRSSFPSLVQLPSFIYFL